MAMGGAVAVRPRRARTWDHVTVGVGWVVVVSRASRVYIWQWQGHGGFRGMRGKKRETSRLLLLGLDGSRGDKCCLLG